MDMMLTTEKLTFNVSLSSLCPPGRFGDRVEYLCSGIREKEEVVSKLATVQVSRLCAVVWIHVLWIIWLCGWIQ